MDATTRNEWIFFSALAAAAAAMAALHPGKAIDFQVYFENARHYFGAGAPMYGPASGMAWPGGIYRYPPIFLDLFRPLAALPLALAAALWAAGKFILAGWLLIRLRRRWELSSVAAFWPGLLLLAPYAIQEVRYGNAQLYVVLLVATAFLIASGRALTGGAWLGFAAALKVWPLFFFPCLAAGRRWRMFWGALASATFWTLLPILWRGPRSQFTLLAQWLAQERSVAVTSARFGELWYPGQSLHDVMARYLSVVDFGQLSDARYRQVAWLHLSHITVDRLWWILVFCLVAALLGLLWRYGARSDAAIALMFAAELVIEPHVHRIIYSALLWPALWLAVELARQRLPGWRGVLYGIAVAVSALEPLVPGSSRQRWLQAFGFDFLLVLVPLVALTASRLGQTRSGHGGADHREAAGA